jgi:probable HAF family extracellular repeat protein
LAWQRRIQPSQSPKPKHKQYKLIDLGTFGGPNSSVPIVFNELNGTAGAQAISDQGTVTGTADTSTPDPLCYLDDCFYPNAFQWRKGVLTNLGALPGSQWSTTNWISGDGLIAGISLNDETDPLIGFPESRAVLWQDSGIADLGTLPGGYESWAFGVNNRGQVVGLATNTVVDPYSYFYGIFGINNGTQTRAFLWDRHNGMQDLGTLGGPDAWANIVNDGGQVKGISYTSFTANANGPCGPTPTTDPFFWARDTGMLDIGGFGGTCGFPNALNNRGQVAGQSYLAGNLVAHGFLWDKRRHPQLTDLGTLGGDNASGLWINDSGEVVGYADLPPNPPGCTGLACIHNGFLWRHGVMTDLGTIGADPCGRALSINSRGQVVGATSPCGGQFAHGFLWENGGPAVDLNTLVAPGSGLSLVGPLYINDRGEIAGYGVLSNGDSHAFLLIPDGDCDSDCEGRIAASQNSAAPAQNPAPLRQSSESQFTPIERVRSMMRQRFGQHPALP